jgi:hypothetical protein
MLESPHSARLDYRLKRHPEQAEVHSVPGEPDENTLICRNIGTTLLIAAVLSPIVSVNSPRSTAIRLVIAT